MPPTKILVATVVDEVEIVAVTYRRAIDREIFEPDFVCRFLVVPGKLFGVRRLDAAFSCALPHGWASDAKFKQSTFKLNHAANVLNRSRRDFHWGVKLITKQVLDVVNQQFLMLHLVFKPEPDYLQN